MVKNACKNCGKYIFDEENINTFKRMTAKEYAEIILQKIIKRNISLDSLLKRFGINIESLVNRSNCELCGAPHAIFSLDDKVDLVRFFYSGTETPSRKDCVYIEEFRSRFLSH